MNANEQATQAVPPGAARLLRELRIEAVDEDLHAATFDGKRLVLAAGRRLVRVAPRSSRVIDQLETFPAHGGLAFDGEYLWQCSEEHIQRVDPRTGFVVRSFSTPLADLTGLECLADELLVLHAGGRALARVAMANRFDTPEREPIADVAIAEPLQGLAWIERRLWSSAGTELRCIDPATGRVVDRCALPPDVAPVRDLAVDSERQVWCVDGRSRVLRALAMP